MHFFSLFINKCRSRCVSVCPLLWDVTVQVCKNSSSSTEIFYMHKKSSNQLLLYGDLYCIYTYLYGHNTRKHPLTIFHLQFGGAL